MKFDILGEQRDELEEVDADLIGTIDGIQKDYEGYIADGVPAHMLLKWFQRDRENFVRMRKTVQDYYGKQSKLRWWAVAGCLFIIGLGLLVALGGGWAGAIICAMGLFEVYLMRDSYRGMRRGTHMLKEYDRLEGRLDELEAKVSLDGEVN